MADQPYIPFYVGDYLKDTRALPLSVRGAWVDMILFMWDAPIRGELVGTLDEVARMIGCTPDEAKFALDLLAKKKTADITLLESGEWKIINRRMRHKANVSKKRSKAGKIGAEAKVASTFAKAKPQAKTKQNTDNDIDNDIDNENIIEIGERSEFSIVIKSKYAGERPRRIYDLAEYFRSTGQLEQITKAGWAERFGPFMIRNPGAIFDDDRHVYNALNKFIPDDPKQLTQNGKRVAFIP